MERRRFIVIAISAAAGGTVLAADACSSGKILGGSSIPGGVPPPTVVHTLNVRYAITNFGGYKLRGRTYNGRTTGPTLVTRPGETLAVKIVNQLPSEPVEKVPHTALVPVVKNAMEAMDPKFRGPLRPSTYIDPMNNPHAFNTTNLHVHGIQTVPHLFDPIGTSDCDAMMIMIKPGETFQYNFPVPADHPSGLFWYHPHKHGSTDVQVSNGMAGLIIVRGPIDEVPEIAAAREIFLVVQTLDVNPSKSFPGVYDREYLAYKTPAEGGYSFSTEFTMLTVNGRGAYWIDNSKSIYTPLQLPQYPVAPGEVIRLRLLNGTNYFPLMLSLPGFESWEINLDGVNTLEPFSFDMSGKNTKLVTPSNFFNAPIFLTMPANRAELLLRAPQKPGIFTLSSLASQGIDFSPRPKIDLANFIVGGAPVAMGIPKKLPVPTREYPVIEKQHVVAYRKFVFDEGPRTDLLTGFGFKISDELYQEMTCTTEPKVGPCEEWRLENKTTEAHPFHLHVNSFQLIAVNDMPIVPLEIWDTFMIPPRVNGVNGSITFRVRFVYWRGKTVFHCHILPHEDTGMMQNFVIS